MQLTIEISQDLGSALDRLTPDERRTINEIVQKIVRRYLSRSKFPVSASLAQHPPRQQLVREAMRQSRLVSSRRMR